MFLKTKEHEPSHIHALYGECVGVFDLKTHEMINGDLPSKAQNLVKEWLSIHDKELQNWNDRIDLASDSIYEYGKII